MNVDSLSSILKEGLAVSTRLCSSVTWHRNIVCRSEKNLVHLLLIDRYLENAITVGTRVSIKLFNEFFVYLFEGAIHSIYAGSPGHVVLQINKVDEIINTRSSPRYDTYIAANLKSEWDNDLYFAIMADISYGGMALLCTHRFEHGEEVLVTSYLPFNQVFYTKGRIIRRNDRKGIIDYSIQFIELEDEGIVMLAKYFSRLEQEKIQMFEDYLLYSSKQ